MEQTTFVDPTPDAPPEIEELRIALHVFRADLTGPEPDKALVESVQRWGVLEPVLIVADVEGNGEDYDVFYQVTDGVRRIKAARRAGLTDVPARLIRGTPAAASVVALIANGQRSPNPAAELAAIERLLAAGADEAAVARATGMSRQTIRKRLRLANLEPSLRPLLSSGQLLPSVAEEAAKLPRGAQRRLLNKLNPDKPLTLGDVRAERRAEASSQPALVPEPEPAEDELMLGQSLRSLAEAVHAAGWDRERWVTCAARSWDWAAAEKEAAAWTA